MGWDGRQRPADDGREPTHVGVRGQAPSLSAVIPVYDEVESLPAFHDELTAALADLSLQTEIVYVDDGSTDGSTELLEKLQSNDPDHVRVVVLRRNFGKSGALAAGFTVATGQLIVTLDADGQDVPAELQKLLDVMAAEDLDVVGGWRAERIDRPVKRVTSRMYNAATRSFTGLDLHDFNTGYKLLRRDVVEELPLYGEFHRFVPVLAHDLGFRVGEVAVHHRPRVAGKSKYLSLLRFPKTMLDLLTVLFLTRFADRPLYLFGGLGAALSAAGLVILAYLSVLRLIFDEGIGSRPLLQFGVLCLLVGVQLIGTGFIGDVLRHSNAAREKPYRIRRVVGALDQAGAPGQDLAGQDSAGQDSAGQYGASHEVRRAADPSPAAPPLPPGSVPPPDLPAATPHEER